MLSGLGRAGLPLDCSGANVSRDGNFHKGLIPKRVEVISTDVKDAITELGEVHLKTWRLNVRKRQTRQETGTQVAYVSSPIISCFGLGGA